MLNFRFGVLRQAVVRTCYSGLIGFFALSAVLFVYPAQAEEVVEYFPDAKNGLALSQKLCASCHLLPGQTERPDVTVGIPTFIEIANRPGQTTDNIINRLIVPHGLMPDIHLTRAEIVDIVTYLQTLGSIDGTVTRIDPRAKKRKYPGPKAAPKS